jgi:hypothetical protein
MPARLPARLPATLRPRWTTARTRRAIRVLFCTGVAVAGVCAATPARLAAQGEADVIRGRVVNDSGKVVSAASVIVTRGPDRLTQQTVTDSTGRYTMRFDVGTGDYLVNIAATGYRTARRRIQRKDNEHELVADFTIARDLSMLAAVKVVADKPVKASNSVSGYNPETGASERWSDGVSGQLPPSSLGDVNALLGTIPGMTITSGGPSILGAASSSNLTTLNGMALAGGSLPRAARTETRVAGATFDPTRGGFAGANIDVRLAGGDRFYQRRNGFVTVDAPQLQFTDAIGRALGAQSGGYRASFGADGEAIRGALTYNVAIDVAHNSSDPATLLEANAATLSRAGVSPDSIARLVSVAGPLGLPLSGLGIPTSRKRDGVTWLGRLDDTRDTLRTLAMTTYAGWNREGALGFGPLAAPAAGGERSDRTLGVQFVHGAYVGPLHMRLTQTRLAASQVHTTTSPYLDLPGAQVLLRSGTALLSNDISSVTLGGAPYYSGTDDRWTVEGSNETVWNARGRKHRFKTQLWGRADGLHSQSQNNEFGTYSFNSLADFQNSHPSSYSRTLTQPERNGAVVNGALAMAHQWTPNKFFNVLYGLRGEANAFATTAPKNVALDQALGVKSGETPLLLHLSPRAGFTYMYNRDKDNGNGVNMSRAGTYYRNATGVIRGGIGDFRDLLKPDVLADVSAASGLPGSTLALSCVGAAVPVPNWTQYGTDVTTIPGECAGGGGVLAVRAPSVALIDPKYDVAHSWRATLNWITNVKKATVKIDALGSYDLSQPSTFDANFNGISRFTLDGEGGRPVYVTPASIDPGSGAVSSSESRKSQDFGRVGLRTSDLRGYGGQMTFGIAPDVFRARLSHSIFTSISYTVQGIRQQFRGFDGATFGDPRTKEWAPSYADARHAIILQAGISGEKIGTFTAFSRLQSGLPFTPLVQGDINGDGRSNDRAFVPNVAVESDAALAAQMRSLLAGASGNVRSCLLDAAGKVAARNSCRGPWTQALNVQWQPHVPKALQPGRTRVNVYFENPLAAIDQLVHGANNLRGWGSSALPDPTLLIARGFDANAKAFKYDVNPRFGNTGGSRTLSRTPFRITFDFTIDLSTNYDVQQLRRALEPIKTKSGWTRRGADSLTAFYASRTSDVYKLILAESDSLFVTPSQTVELKRADSVFTARVREIFTPLGDFLANEPQGSAGKAALDTVAATQKKYWKSFWAQPEIASEILTPLQRELLPMIKSLLAVRQKDRESSQFYFGYPVTMK